jgi:site-specific recombinase XerD
MKNKSEKQPYRTLVKQACLKVQGFEDFYKRLSRKIRIAGKSPSTLSNYTRYLAQMALHFECVPTELDTEQVEEYLEMMLDQHDTPSESYFKFVVYSLRFAFKAEGLDYKRFTLPSIKRDKKLPVILSREEMRRLLRAPALLKHRLLIGLLYGCGLRCMEVRSIHIRDLDLDRRLLHVRKGKGRKDRYVPLGELLCRGVRSYLEAENPQTFLFNGKPEGRKGGDFDSRYSQRGVQWAVQQAAKTAGIQKDISVHTLRHTYATHLLEDGLDIVSIKELLGHERIETTMVYLHVAKHGRKAPFSPLDTLFTPGQ